MVINLSNIKKTLLRPFILLIFVFSISNFVVAQNELVDQTLNTSKKLLESKKFSEAADVLGSFENLYPGNIWVERLYAQTLFWMHDFDKASKIYERALGFHPDNLELKYEYAMMLFDYEKYDYAKKLLIEYTSTYTNVGDAEIMLGKIYYYQRQFKEAVIHLEKAHKLNPEDKSTEKLYWEVYRIIAPQMFVGGSYRIDEQPMHAYGPRLKFSWYRSDILDFGITGDIFSYSDIPTSNTNSSVKLSNSFGFIKSGIKLKVSAGAVYSKLGTNLEWCGGIQFLKTFKKPIKIELQAERKNYDYTVSSVSSLLMVSHYAFNVSIGKQNSWNGIAGAQSNYFPDNNYVSSYYLWFLSHPIKVSKLNLYFGYAFNFTNSKEDRFETIYSVDQIINNYTEKIEGIYNPYYTPINQFTNSVLTNIDLRMGSSTVVRVHASVGLYSTIDAPYFYLDNNAMSNTVFVKAFSNQRYIPLDLGISMQSELSNRIELNISYSYLSTYYFVTNNFDLGLKIYF